MKHMKYYSNNYEWNIKFLWEKVVYIFDNFPWMNFGVSVIGIILYCISFLLFPTICNKSIYIAMHGK